MALQAAETNVGLSIRKKLDEDLSVLFSSPSNSPPSSITRYGVVRDAVNTAFVPSDIPRGCRPIRLNLVARDSRSHQEANEGTGNLAKHLQELVRDPEERKSSLDGVPDWLKGWSSPWKGKVKGGELIVKGEQELYDLGIRVWERFPELFGEEYHPNVNSVKATQVPRAAASAVAFGIGLFSGRGTLGLGKRRAFAVTSKNRSRDIMLRI